MNKVREVQLKVLDIFSKCPKSFALAGGTALELYYLKHRFSKDLDFFSSEFNKREIKEIVLNIGKKMDAKITLENEFKAGNQAKVIFYSLNLKKSSSILKIDFVEDVFFNKPIIKKYKGVPVYAAKQIYFQKIIAITGTNLSSDSIGKGNLTGRNEIRDIVDIYYLSKKIEPLHSYLKKLPNEQQRGMIQWYRSFSRQEFKLGFLDIDVYDKKLDSIKIIRYLENEINLFLKEVLE